jgi:RNA polymerase sigma-70 factor, ECF subfamily
MQPFHSDLTWVQAAVRGNPRAIEWVAERLTRVPRIVERLAARFGRGAAELADVAQDVAVVVLRRLADYHGRAPFDAWLHRVCVQTLLSARRRQRRHVATTLEFEPATTELTPEATLAEQEQSRQLCEGIDRVGGVEAEVLRLRHLDGLDFATISARTGIAMATLRTRYYRGLRRLQDRLVPPADNAQQ